MHSVSTHGIPNWATGYTNILARAKKEYNLNWKCFIVIDKVESQTRYVKPFTFRQKL